MSQKRNWSRQPKRNWISDNVNLIAFNDLLKAFRSAEDPPNNPLLDPFDVNFGFGEGKKKTRSY